jgi:predicted metalloprotease with PDZ domain
MPNNLNLSGNYDWFYEGFALYQSLRMGVAVNRLRFEDFLDTLARAHSIDTLQTQRASLVDASKNRWNGSNTQVYARGMLVAFLCDIAVLQRTKGKTSLSDVLREIYRKYSFPNARSEGNAAVLSVLRGSAELRSIVDKYVEGAENIVWKTDLQAVGIESAEENFQTKLKVATKPNGRQKDLLNELGYNNWRKLSNGSK